MHAELSRLLIDCPDAKGLVAAVAGFIGEHGGNILESDHHTDPDEGRFFMRAEFNPADMLLDEEGFREAWQSVAVEYRMTWRLAWRFQPKRVAVLVSRQTHCLSDLLWRWANDEIPCEMALVISNHSDGAAIAESFGLPFHHVPIPPGGKEKQEELVRSLLDREEIDLIVLARYMQVLSPEFVEAFPQRIINIHHSFLPAFAGARPYHQAFAKGVKIIGATSHFVTADLDEGPIIAQQTAPVSHRDRIEDLVRKGRDLERIVLAQSVRLYLEDKILVSGNKTVVFE